MRIRKLSFLVAALTAVAALPLTPQCTTPYTFVDCTNCPQGCDDCFGSGQFSYQVFGNPVSGMFYCNNQGGGNCADYGSCLTISSVAVSVDCNGNYWYNNGSMCCTDCFVQ